MNRRFKLLCVTAALVWTAASYAQEGTGDSSMQRITPAEQNATDAGIMTTHKEAAPEKSNNVLPMPWSQPEEPLANQPATANTLSPFAAPAQAPAPAPTAAQAPGAPATFQPKIPFGRGEAGNAPVVPSGPHTTVAVPVVDVDAVEAAEPQPPTPTPPEADPAKEDPAEPTELTSPIFNEDKEPDAPRRTVIRALNKVTAQSELISLKPNETMKFGQLEITGITCRTSAAESQTDFAGLLDISERVTTAKQEKLKPLFRGWMYASSPSITALEHPVYDVTMVECKMIAPAPKKDDDKDAKTASKPAKKGKK